MRMEQRRIHDVDGRTGDCLEASLPGAGPRTRLLELVLVSIAVVILLALCRRTSGHWAWPLGPLALIAGAVLTTLARGRDLAGLGLGLGRVRQGLLLLGVSGACMLVLGLTGVALFKHLSIPLPLAASIPQERWPVWVLFQLVYVAFPEELFFRGYLLSNSLYLLKTAVRMNSSSAAIVSIVLSAGVFALAHVLVLGGAASALTFLPGLLFGWVFLRMGSLLPSILLRAGSGTQVAGPSGRLVVVRRHES
jgi:membrane protease YdiL (CAAX protease family)